MSSQEEEALNKALINTYFSNLELLKSYDKDLYSRLIGFSQVIDSGMYKERYQLEFIKEKGEFDILDTTTNLYIYNKKAKQFNHKLINGIKFDKSSYFSMLIPELYNLNNKYQEVDLDYETYEDIEGIIRNDIKEFTDILKDDTSSQKTFKKIDKFIFIGTLLGRHMLDIKKKVNAKSYFVYENNLEIFRLSLFVTSYVDLISNARVSFSIMDDENIFMMKYQLFLENDMYENYYLKYATTGYNVSKAMHTMISTLYKINPVTFDYTRILHNLVKLTTKRINTKKILTVHKKSNNFIFIKNKPVLFIAAGPSLEHNISWIEENQNKFVIVAIGASYKKLLNNGITPDIVSTVEPSYKDLIKYQFSDEDTNNLKDTIILASILTPEPICDKFSSEQLFFYELNYSLKNSPNVYKGYSVGEITVSILLDLGIEELYLIGTDLAVNQDTGETHFSDYKKEVSIKHKLEDFDITNMLKNESSSFKEELILVKGNFQKEVFTTRIFVNSIFAYAQTLSTFKKENQKVINLSNYGAYLEGTNILNVKEVNVSNYKNLDKNRLKDEVSRSLNLVSQNKLTKDELEIISFEIDYFEKILKELKTIESKEFNTFSEFNDFMITFENSIKQIGYATFLDFLMTTYFKFINIYLSYYFNDKKIKNEVKKVKQVKEVWVKQVDRLLSEYLTYFNNIKLGNKKN